MRPARYRISIAGEGMLNDGYFYLETATKRFQDVCARHPEARVTLHDAWNACVVAQQEGTESERAEL